MKIALHISARSVGLRRGDPEIDFEKSGYVFENVFWHRYVGKIDLELGYGILHHAFIWSDIQGRPSILYHFSTSVKD